MSQQHEPPQRGRARWLVAAVLAVSAALSQAVGPVAASASAEDPAPRLTLVTLQGSGTAGISGGNGTPAQRGRMLEQQDALLDSVGATEQPVYRWTAALNGFAALLTESQREQVQRHPDVVLVEANEVRPLAHARTVPTSQLTARSPRMRGGAGVVVGVVDSGIAVDSPVFAEVPGLGREPQGFDGTCQPGVGWTHDTCNRKVAGARWFIAGFGPQRIRASESLSARDVLGHGTQVASVAAGNAGVTVRIAGRDAGSFGGVAPQARIAAYKACWAAPNPADDGCATADLVTAVDRAVADGVDVLNLSVAGGEGMDTLQHALLGAAEDEIVVVGAAGNSARTSFAAHPTPWVTTLGAVTGRLPRARVRPSSGSSRPTFSGTGRPGRVSGRLVLGGRAAARGATRAEARQCLPGSLDAREVGGRIVLCERGGIGRIDKSRAVAQADGIGMVLVNTDQGGTSADFHSVPTVHLGRREGAALRRWATGNTDGRIVLSPEPEGNDSLRVPVWTASGDPRATLVKPDAVAVADSLVGALPAESGWAWGPFSGTSASAAQASGMAALLRARHRDWSAAVVRSVLVSSAEPIDGASVLQQGAGSLGHSVPRTHLALDVPAHQWRRAVQTRTVAGLNLSSILLPTGQREVTRRVRNIGDKAEYFSAEAEGFTAHRVQVRPLAVRLAPGESATFRITLEGSPSPRRLDDGYVVWRGARGGVTRIPVALTR